jgi:acyl-CoA thioesterase FadM
MENLETGDIAATCEMTGVHFDRTARRPRPLPSEVVVRVQDLLEGQRRAGA